MHENNLYKLPPKNLPGATKNELLVVQRAAISKIEGSDILVAVHFRAEHRFSGIFRQFSGGGRVWKAGNQSEGGLCDK